MARPKKQITIYKEALESLSYRERLKEYLRLFYADEPAAIEKVGLVKASFDSKEKKEFNSYYLPVFTVLIKEKNMFKLLSIIIVYYSLYINDILKDIENNKNTIQLINSILSVVKAANDSSEQKENSPLARIEKILKEYESVSGGIKIDRSEYYLNADCSAYEDFLSGALSNLKKHLATAKSYYIALDEYARLYKIEDLIPKEIQELANTFMCDLSSVWWNSSRVYKEYSKKENRTKEDEDIIGTIKKSIIFPNLFPDYEDVEPDKDLIGKNNILVEQCAIKI